MKQYLVIDTDSYSGNFERQMCAYITGRIGECDVGEKEARIAKSEIDSDILGWFNLNILSEPDDNGCYRPVKIYPTPGFYNDGRGKHYKISEKKPEGRTFPAYQSIAIGVNQKMDDQVLKVMKSRAQDFADNNDIKIIGFRWVVETVVVDEQPI